MGLSPRATFVLKVQLREEEQRGRHGGAGGARHFFRVRLWNQSELLDQIFEHYDQLDEEIRAELPLKRIWTVVLDETEEG
jgi:hypothetical protein